MATTTELYFIINKVLKAAAILTTQAPVVILSYMV